MIAIFAAGLTFATTALTVAVLVCLRRLVHIQLQLRGYAAPDDGPVTNVVLPKEVREADAAIQAVALLSTDCSACIDVAEAISSLPADARGSIAVGILGRDRQQLAELLNGHVHELSATATEALLHSLPIPQTPTVVVLTGDHAEATTGHAAVSTIRRIGVLAAGGR